MERLTERGPRGFAYYPACIGCCDGLRGKCIGCDENGKQCEALAAYEDTGLTPEEITALKKKADAPFGMDTVVPDIDQCKLIAPAWDSYFRVGLADNPISAADVMALMLIAAVAASGSEDKLRAVLGLIESEADEDAILKEIETGTGEGRQ